MRGRTIALSVVGVFVVLFVGTQVAMHVLKAELPQDRRAGPEADALARKIEAAVRVDAWAETGAVSFRFIKNEHLWDRRRQRARIRFGKKEVWVDLSTHRGIAKKEGQTLSGTAAEQTIAEAERVFYNDTFWLNPLWKMFDEGVLREKVTLTDEPAGSEGLLVSYTKGGVTPGDAYVWIVDREGRPFAWRIWTAVFPIKGIRMSWDQWSAQPTGALISLERHFPGVTIHISDLVSARTLEELVTGPDPFALLEAEPTP